MATKAKPFDVSMFVPTKFESAEDKAWFANHLAAFIEAGFPEAKFTHKFYDRLNMTFGFIANYNREGFYSTFFTNTPDKIRFLNVLLEHDCLGDARFTYSDVERAVQGYLLEAGILRKYEAQNCAEVEEAERRTLARLKAKYEPTIEPIVTGERIPPLSEFISRPAVLETAPAAIQELLF